MFIRHSKYRHSKYSAILSKIYSYRLFFRSFCQLGYFISLAKFDPICTLKYIFLSFYVTKPVDPLVTRSNYRWTAWSSWSNCECIFSSGVECGANATRWRKKTTCLLNNVPVKNCTYQPYQVAVCDKPCAQSCKLQRL